MSNSEVFMDFRLSGPGWADLELRIGEQTFLMGGVSYTTDVLGDLLRMALMLATGAWIARASFDGEPREWRLVGKDVWGFGNHNARFQISVLEFPDFYESLADEKGQMSFEVECDKSSFTQSVLDMTQRFVAAISIEKYEWGNHPFPVRALAALETALTIEDSANSPQTV